MQELSIVINALANAVASRDWSGAQRLAGQLLMLVDEQAKQHFTLN